MEGISHSINKTQLVKTEFHSGPGGCPDSPKLSKNLVVADSGLLNCSSATPSPHIAPQLGLAPDLEAAWGQPSNQI